MPSFLTARDLESRQGRKVMVIVTDGGDTSSAKDSHAALQAAQLADAVIYPVVVMPITNDAGRNIGGEHALQFMAEGTGGRPFLPSVGAALDRAFADIITELRTQYLLAFYPHDAPLTKDPFHKLEVRVGRPELRVSARNGYYGEVEGGTGTPGARTSIDPDGRKSGRKSEYSRTRWKAGRAPEQTFEEIRYLKQLIEKATPVRVKMEDGEEVVGTIEYYDRSFIRLTRQGLPNLFIFKHDIKYLQEES